MRKGRRFSLALSGMAFALAAGLWFTAQDSIAGPNSGHPIKGRYSFRMTPVKSFSADAPGDPGGLASAPRQDILRVGHFLADGEGNLRGRTLATTDTNTGDTWIVQFTWTGNYTLNPDGTGFFSINEVGDLVCTQMTGEHSGSTPHPTAADGLPLAGNIPCPEDVEGHEDYAFVFTARGGKSMEFIQTDNAGGGSKVFMTGVATAREAFGRDEHDEEEEED